MMSHAGQICARGDHVVSEESERDNLVEVKPRVKPARYSG